MRTAHEFTKDLKTLLRRKKHLTGSLPSSIEEMEKELYDWLKGFVACAGWGDFPEFRVEEVTRYIWDYLVDRPLAWTDLRTWKDLNGWQNLLETDVDMEYFLLDKIKKYIENKKLRSIDDD